MPVPDFFIVGAPRCGTTALYQYLKHHPEIFMPEVKEMHFFGSDLLSGSAYRDKEKYFEQFADTGEAKRTGEASVWYLYSEKAPREIKEFNPESRILIMLRHPVDMIQSLHAKLLLTGDEDIKDFNKALAAEDSRKQVMQRPDGSFPVVPVFYRENAKFAKHVKRWLDEFGRDRVRVIIFEEFAADPALEYKKTLEFLGVDGKFQPDFEPVNPSRKIRSLILHRVLQKLPESIWAARRALLPDTIHPGRALMNLNAPTQPPPPIDPALRQELLHELQPDLVGLGQLLDCDLAGAWK